MEKYRAEEKEKNQEISVSIIVPVYNAEDTLYACAGNLIHQTLENIEIIFIDDVSTDGSALMLQEIQKAAPDIVKCYRTEYNSGPGAARNLGLAQAVGEYIGFVDSDDIADISMFDQLYRKAKEEDCDFVDCLFLDEEKQQVVQGISKEQVGILDWEKKNQLISREGYIWNKIYRRKFLVENKVHFRNAYIMEDTDFILYIYATARKGACLEQPLYKHTAQPSSLTHGADRKKWGDATLDVMKAVYERMHQLPYYEEIRQGTEAMIISLYFNAVFQYASSIELTREERIRSLKEAAKLKKQIVKGGYDNPYRIPELDENCIQLISANDICPEEVALLFVKE